MLTICWASPLLLVHLTLQYVLNTFERLTCNVTFLEEHAPTPCQTMPETCNLLSPSRTVFGLANIIQSLHSILMGMRHTT
jgi:hypothetical protein